jgi:hypothetical protein
LIKPRLFSLTSLRPLLLVLCSWLLLLAPSAKAYYAVMDNGEILAPGKYKLTPSMQFLTDSGGVNLSARGDMGFTDEFGGRVLFGMGKTDYFLGGLVKWMPVPDVDRQPAIGMNVGLLYGKDRDTRDLTIRVEPLVSKKLNVGDAKFTPYASLPLGLRMRNSSDPRVNEDTKLAIQLVAGTQLEIPHWKNLQFMGEIGLDLENAPSHVSFGAVLYFDEEGFSLN